MKGLQVRGIRKTYSGFVAVDDVSLEAAAGGCLAVVGPNGAGKSTLFAIISGQTIPDAGTVVVNDVDVTRIRPDKRSRHGLSRTFQVARLFKSFTVREAIVVAMQSADRTGGLGRDPMRSSALRSRSAAVLELVRMSSSADRKITELTQGERKRLEFGMAYAQEPTVLVLDEPTAGMGRADTETVIDVLREAKESTKDLMILLTAHDMDVVFGLADRLAVMAGGRVLLEGPPREVANDPRVAEVYMGGRGE